MVTENIILILVILNVIRRPGGYSAKVQVYFGHVFRWLPFPQIVASFCAIAYRVWSMIK